MLSIQTRKTPFLTYTLLNNLARTPWYKQLYGTFAEEISQLGWDSFAEKMTEEEVSLNIKMQTRERILSQVNQRAASFLSSYQRGVFDPIAFESSQKEIKKIAHPEGMQRLETEIDLLRRRQIVFKEYQKEVDTPLFFTRLIDL